MSIGASGGATNRSPNGWFLAADGIREEVLREDIKSYLGPGATFSRGFNAEGVPGFCIFAIRNFTPAMIEDLKTDSADYPGYRLTNYGQ
ncbi:hypothetical protein EJ06DRAFT_555237 [Trichodelitschia bisporula]|uniref:Uncharacterized protein n=1 Tax=Trichodelitschia bisporula TaxID=703511 RepID=A0A6G1I2V0_9PEZI|nr:hypothetical protein EJ06DRAFT_555237 [Trichodelitschia bisporula]